MTESGSAARARGKKPLEVVPDEPVADHDLAEGGPDAGGSDESDAHDEPDGGPEGTGELDEFGGPVGRGSVRTIRAPWRASSVARVRRAVVLDLQARGLSDLVVDEAEIVSSELVSNAVRHARPLQDGMIRVRWKTKGDAVEIEVTDGGGATTPKPVPRVLWAASGRGLRIVRSLAHEWGVTEDARKGVTVWAALGGPSRRRSI